MIAAIEQAFPKALRQRCLIHRARNVLAKVLTGMRAEIKDAYRKLFDTEDPSVIWCHGRGLAVGHLIASDQSGR
jgi:putative transposase